MTIKRLSEIRNDDGKLTHKMCCICFKMTPIADLWRDGNGEKRDVCSDQCARLAGEMVGDWKAGDQCGKCGSRNTVVRRDGSLLFGHCNDCGADDEDDG